MLEKEYSFRKFSYSGNYSSDTVFGAVDIESSFKTFNSPRNQRAAEGVIRAFPGATVFILTDGVTALQLEQADYEYEVLEDTVRVYAPVHKGEVLKDRIDGHKGAQLHNDVYIAKIVNRSSGFTIKEKIETMWHCAYSEAIHDIIDAFTVAESIEADNNYNFDKNVEKLSQEIANCFFQLENGVWSVNSTYGTIEMAEIARAKVKLRLAADKDKEQPALTHYMSVEDFKSTFINPLPAAIMVAAESINDRTATPITLDITKARIKSFDYQWEQAVGRLWSDVAGATEATYTPTTAGKYRVKLHNIKDVDDVAVPDVFSDFRVITVG